MNMRILSPMGVGEVMRARRFRGGRCIEPGFSDKFLSSSINGMSSPKPPVLCCDPKLLKNHDGWPWGGELCILTRLSMGTSTPLGSPCSFRGVSFGCLTVVHSGFCCLDVKDPCFATDILAQDVMRFLARMRNWEFRQLPLEAEGVVSLLWTGSNAEKKAL